jgi:hypothetical protein
MPPTWLVRAAIAAVWIYEGLWCKLLGRDPNQRTIVEAVPRWGPRVGGLFLKTLGVVECLMGAWALSGIAPLYCALAQTGLLVALNTSGLVFARHLIHDPAGMVVKNFAFLVLAWVSVRL